VANPLATILAAAMLLRHSLQLEAEAAAIERAVQVVLQQGHRTRDLATAAPWLTTAEMGSKVIAALAP
jgi:3-isopropylmalate dehydrogenase